MKVEIQSKVEMQNESRDTEGKSRYIVKVEIQSKVEMQNKSRDAE